MAHGKALGQYKIIPNKYEYFTVWDVVDALGNVVCHAFDSQLKAVNHIVKVLLPMERN